jgi:hypothetical protein
MLRVDAEHPRIGRPADERRPHELANDERDEEAE